MDNRYASRDRFLKVAVVGTRTSMEGKRYGHRRSDLADAANIKALSHVSTDHVLKQPMHISDRWSQDVDSRCLDKAFGVGGLRQKTRALRHAFVDLRAAADETKLALDDYPRIDRLDGFDGLPGKRDVLIQWVETSKPIIS